jgi:hypothetical protein
VIAGGRTALTERLAIRADSISKVYRLYDSPLDRLRELLFRTPRHRPFHALKRFKWYVYP